MALGQFPGAVAPGQQHLYTGSYRTDARITKLIPIMIKDRATSLTLNFEAFNVSNSGPPRA